MAAMKNTKKPRRGTRNTPACIAYDGRLKSVKDASIRQEFQGDVLNVRSPAYVCTGCGRHYLKGSQADRLRHNTAEEYRRRHNLLSSAQIERCRRQLRLSIEEFAGQLKTTPTDVRRWTTWLVQDRTTDQRIRRLFGLFNLVADHYERFLTAHMSARRLCTETGFADDANELVPVLCGLQSAYERLVQHKANCLLLGVVRVVCSGRLTAKEAQKIFGLNADAMEELLRNRGENSAQSSESTAALQMAEGGSWSAGELKNRFGYTADDLCYRRVGHGLVFWRNASGAFRFPGWQFTKQGAVLPGIAEILRVLQSDDGWMIMRYFLARRQQLQGRRPLDLLRAGEVEKVLAHTQIHCLENTW